MENKDNKDKYNAQKKYRKKNYKQFNIDFKPYIFDKFVSVCKKNNTKPTTEIKKFVEEYIRNNI